MSRPRPRREAAAPHHRRHPAPARPAERDVDRARDRARRAAAARSATTTTPGSWSSPARAAAFCSGLDLKDYGVIPNIDGLHGRPHRAAVDALLLAADPHAAADAPAGDRRGQRPRVRRRHVPRRSAPSCGSRRSRPTFNATGIVNGLTSTELGASWLLPRLVGAAHSQRHAAHRPQDRRGRGATAWGSCRACCPTTELLDRGRSTIAARHVRVQPVRPRDDQGHPLGEPREPEPRGGDRDRGPQPADARASPRTCPRRSGRSTRTATPSTPTSPARTSSPADPRGRTPGQCHPNDVSGLEPTQQAPAASDRAHPGVRGDVTRRWSTQHLDQKRGGRDPQERRRRSADRSSAKAPASPPCPSTGRTATSARGLRESTARRRWRRALLLGPTNDRAAFDLR